MVYSDLGVRGLREAENAWHLLTGHHTSAHTSRKKVTNYIQRVLDLAGVTQTHPSSVGRLMKTPSDSHINNLNFQRPAFTPDLLKLSPAPESRRGREREDKLP